jgi:hypothetical protein
MRAARLGIAATMAALVCVAAAVAQPSKIKLRIDAVSHTYVAGKTLLCARISGTAGASLVVEAYGAGVPDQHTWTQALMPPRGQVVVGFTVTQPGDYRLKVTANKPKQGRAVATSDYLVPPQDIAARGVFGCA